VKVQGQEEWGRGRWELSAASDAPPPDESAASSGISQALKQCLSYNMEHRYVGLISLDGIYKYQLRLLFCFPLFTALLGPPPPPFPLSRLSCFSHPR